jgi:hypothetical protein
MARVLTDRCETGSHPSAAPRIALTRRAPWSGDLPNLHSLPPARSIGCERRKLVMGASDAFEVR